MFHRPKPGEDEDDILKQQEEFLRAKGVMPSACVINKRKTEQDSNGAVTTGENVDPRSSSKKFKSKFSSSRGQSTSNKDIKKTSEVRPLVLGEIRERTVSAKSFLAPVDRPSSDGFPRAFPRDKTLTGVGKSIFAQQLAKMKNRVSDVVMQHDAIEKSGVSDVDMQQDTVRKTVSHEDIIGDRSYILTGSSAGDVHQENVKKLAAMTIEEIREEQQKLLRQLDPKLIDFIKSRRVGRVEKPGASHEVSGGTMDIDPECEGMTAEQKPCERLVLPGEVAARGTGEASAPDTAWSEMSAAGGIMAEANKWLHMDVVEKEKLQWMTDLPQAQPVPPDQPYAARFNFEGVLLPYVDERVGVNQALHHHGEEPERPGYTLQELCQLSRSSVLQQRVLALTTIANIIQKTKSGYYDEYLQAPLLEQLQDADIFLLLRFSLDDNTETQLTATLAAIRNLLCSDADEVCLGRLLGSPGGLRQPSLGVEVKDKTVAAEEQAEAEAELKDHQMLKWDLIKGALRTDLVLRLRYILEVLKPCPKAVISVLEILTRIARHSHDSTLAVTCCPHLMKLITSQFVPQDWSQIVGADSRVDMKSVYGVPLVEALKLLRVVASRSRILASDLVHKYSIMDAIISYISIDPRECGLPHKEALQLSLESLYLWQTFLSYNIATQHFSDLFHVVTRLLQFHLSVTCIGDEASFGQEHGAAVLSLLECAVKAAHAQETAFAEQRAAGSGERLVLSLGHGHVAGYLPLLERCVCKWLAQLPLQRDISFSSGKLVGAALSCLAMYIDKFLIWPGSDVVSYLENIEALFGKYLAPFVSSPIFTEVMHSIRRSSCLLSNDESGLKRDPAALASLGALCWGGREVVPIVGPSSQLSLMLGLVSLLTHAYSAHKGLNKECVGRLLAQPTLQEHLGLVASQGKLAMPSGWFVRQEVVLLCRVALLAAACPDACDRPELFHAAGLRLATLVQRQDRSLLARLFPDLVFNQHFLRESPVLVSRMESLKLNDDDSASRHKLLTDALSSLPEIQACYKAALGLADVREVSPLDVTSLTAGQHSCEAAIPADWFYMPILSLYNRERSGEMASDSAVMQVQSSLQWLFLAECICPQAVATVSITARFCRLCTVFLAASDLFLNPSVHNYLEALLKLLLTKNHELDFAEKIPGLSSFYDLYTQLLDQFRAVSYGDKLFGQFVLVPLQQRQSVDFRKLIWSEYVSVLRLLPASWDEPLFPCDMLLEPREVDPSLLACYLNALMSGVVSESQSPVLYHCAAEHVASFVTGHPDTTVARQLRARINKIGSVEVREILLRKIEKNALSLPSSTRSQIH